MNNPAQKLRTGILAIACFAIAQFVSGCIGTSPATRYYAFTATEFVNNVDGDLIISVGPFEIPDYLNRPQIVLREQGTSLKVLGNDRWAESLNDSVTRIVGLELNNELSSGQVYQFPNTTNISPDYKVRGRIYNFEANTDGTVILRVRWGAVNRDNEFVIETRNESFSTTVSSSDDVAAITNAMEDLLGEFARKIASGFEKIDID